MTSHLSLRSLSLCLGFALFLGAAATRCSFQANTKGASGDTSADAAEAGETEDARLDSEAGSEGLVDALEASDIGDVVPDPGVDADADAALPPEADAATEAIEDADALETTETVAVDGPPPSCCADDDDCLLGGVAPYVCRGQGLGSEPWGVCVLAPVEGRCYADGDCGGGMRCEGASLCPCNVDCDMGYEGPGICVPSAEVCVAIEGSWVQEICDAASLVYWDGASCRTSEPGECGCEPFCEYVYPDMATCLGACGGCVIFEGGCDDAIPDQPWWYFDGTACVEEDSCMCEGCPGTYANQESCEQACHQELPVVDCPDYVAATRACPYAWKTFPASIGACPDAVCMEDACAVDADCVPPRAPVYDGQYCVLGNCVTCWQDSQCDAGEVCRAGRCVIPEPEACSNTTSCQEAGCHVVQASEVPCPVCVCDAVADKACAVDEECLQYSSYPYGRCVYGRCAECTNDDDCASGTGCAPPGFCVAMDPMPRALVGTWLIGWGGDMDHFSYFRFEADGVLRRGSYAPDGAWADDIPGLPCYPDGVMLSPLIGTWEPVMNESGSLVVDMSLNLSCDPGAGWSVRFLVSISDDGSEASFFDAYSPDAIQYNGFRKSPGNCDADFGFCVTPIAPATRTATWATPSETATPMGIGAPRTPTAATTRSAASRAPASRLHSRASAGPTTTATAPRPAVALPSAPAAPSAG